MKRIRKAVFDRNRETSTLFFRDYDDSAEFFLRGGIYWPNADSNGFVVLAGQEVQTNKIWIFEEAEFQTVEDIIQEGQIRYHGVSHFFNKAWSRYFCRLFFYAQSDATHKRFSLQVYRSQTIKPTPGFLEISLADKDEARHIVFEQIRTGRLVLDQESEVARQLESARLDGDTLFPGVEALGRALAGLAKFPFNRHSVEPAADI
jgi:hypothetical protein